MREPLVVLLLMVTACAAPTNAPSLAPRPAEAIDPRVPVPEAIVPSTPSLGLQDQLNDFVAEAVAGDNAFRPLADNARRMADGAGARESESWVLAQQALSAAVAARAPVAKAVVDVNSVAAERIQAGGGIGRADLKAIDDASARIAGIDSQEAALIAEIQSRLER